MMDEKQLQRQSQQVKSLHRMVGEIGRLPTTFHIGSEEWFQADGILHLPTGTGILGNHGDMYRVVDSWLSFDHHGRYGEGMHIFMEPDEDEHNTLRQVAPDYFEADS
jgi:hypothetical protein